MVWKSKRLLCPLNLLEPKVSMPYSEQYFWSSSGQRERRVNLAPGSSLLTKRLTTATWAADPLFHEQFTFIRSIFSTLSTPNLLLEVMFQIYNIISQVIYVGNFLRSSCNFAIFSLALSISFGSLSKNAINFILHRPPFFIVIFLVPDLGAKWKKIIVIYSTVINEILC